MRVCFYWKTFVRDLLLSYSKYRLRCSPTPVPNFPAYRSTCSPVRLNCQGQPNTVLCHHFIDMCTFEHIQLHPTEAVGGEHLSNKVLFLYTSSSIMKNSISIIIAKLQQNSVTINSVFGNRCSVFGVNIKIIFIA